MIRSWVVLFLALVLAVVCAAQAPQSTPSSADTSQVGGSVVGGVVGGVIGTWTLTAAERLLPAEAEDLRGLHAGAGPRPPDGGAGRGEPHSAARARRAAPGDGRAQRRLRILVQGRRDRSAVPGLLRARRRAQLSFAARARARGLQTSVSHLPVGLLGAAQEQSPGGAGGHG